MSGLRRGLWIGVAAFAAAVQLAGAAPVRVFPTGDRVEVVVTLAAPPLARQAARERTLAGLGPRRLELASSASAAYLRRLASAQRSLRQRIVRTIPTAQVRWRYSVVANGLAVVVPRGQTGRLASVPGVARVWPSVRYRPLLDRTPALIGAPVLWGPGLETAGNGMKIGIIDDGIDEKHPFFDPTGYTMPPGFPKGNTAFTTAKVIVARAFAPLTPRYRFASVPFDPELSAHATHVAGIAAGNADTRVSPVVTISGVAPRAYLGNYKALTIPNGGLNGNSPEIAAAIEAAVRDGMDVINLSLGEIEIEPSRDLVVQAIDAAADAGVVAAVSAGNDFADFGHGSIGSPATAEKAITVAASTGGHGSPTPDEIASFSSAGPTPVSLRMKPDVTAPGASVLSAIPVGFTEESGTSMASPHVAGAAALLIERHPDWTPAQVKSALELTGDPVRSAGREVSASREGGGRIDLPRADRPLVFARPSGLSFGLLRAGRPAARTVRLTDAGGGAGTWTVAAVLQSSGVSVRVPATVTVPGSLRVTAAARRAANGEADGFVVLTQAGERRRIPFWAGFERPRLGAEPHGRLVRPGTYSADLRRGRALVSTYRYPDLSPTTISTRRRLPGPELVYRVVLRRPAANLGVAVVARARGVRVEPRIVAAGDENRLRGYAALPINVNPYTAALGQRVPAAAILRPSRGAFDVVFDTPSRAAAGPFTFRFWIADTTPPTIRRLRSSPLRGTVAFAVHDGGSGVDPASLSAGVGADNAAVTWDARRGLALVDVEPGRHVVTLSAADYQEAKNNENVTRILPNTRTVRVTVTVARR